MKRFIEVIARTSDLIEAHGRALRASIRAEASELRSSVRDEGRLLRGVFASAGLGVLCLLIAGVCFLGGAGLIFTAGYLWMEPRFGAPAAAAGVGLAVLVMGGAALWSFKRLMAA